MQICVPNTWPALTNNQSIPEVTLMGFAWQRSLALEYFLQIGYFTIICGFRLSSNLISNNSATETSNNWKNIKLLQHIYIVQYQIYHFGV